MKNPKIEKAYDAMKALGINRDVVRPVLKRLHKLYDKDWSFIEAENYRALVDAVFEEDKEFEKKRKKPVDVDVSEPPLKKLHVVFEDDEASSTINSNGTRMIPVEDDVIIVPSISLSNGRPETSGSRSVKVKTENGSCSAMNKGKSQILTPAVSDSAKIMSERASSSSGVSEKVPDSKQCDIALKPLSGNASNVSALPDLVEASSTGHMSTKLSQCIMDPENDQKTECKLEIVSSSSGDVKLCCIGNATSLTPDSDHVLKSVEEKFLRTHKVVGSPFSLKNLLQELCNSFLESTNDTENKVLPSQENGPSQIVQEGRKKQTHVYIDDIAKGEESLKISLVDENGNGNGNRSRDPPKFFYIPKNIIYQKANVNISLARISDEDCCSSCSGDCLSSSVPCGCTRVTNGEFAYTSEGLLKSRFLRDCLSDNRREVSCQDCPMERATNPKNPGKCKGHPVRKFIKECWSKCGCNMHCGNRVVQRGISRKLQVFWTPGGKGWGLRTTEDIPMGAFVCEYVGEVVTNTELDERNRRSKGKERHTYPVHLDADWNSESILDDDFALCLDATNYGNVARFINHRCSDATMIDIPVEVETVDHHYYHVAFFTKREVKAYEELNWDYGIDFDDKNHPIKAFQCRCGSSECRDKSRKGSKSKARTSTR